ncbi:MAG: hypothetical protein IIX16_03050 [Clostridia bacterium]|nr:hypothetical protein [Clostridia bacterium]
MEKIIVRDVILKQNRIEYKVELSNGIADAFNQPFEYWVEYNEIVESLPKSIAIIPFICNVLPIVWVADAELCVPEIDEDFLMSLEKTKKAYVDMYPNIAFKGKLREEKVIKNEKNFKNEKRKSTAFFSGGVDSWATLVSHIGEDELNLVTIWGSDVKLDDDKSWKKVENYTQKVADSLNLKAIFIKSTFRESLNYTFLDNLISGKVRNNSWWYFIQHGIALIGHVAPYAYLNNIDLHYIPASCSAKDRNKQLASYKTIDETVKMAWCDVVHDQFELLRIERLKKIIDWRSLTGEEVVLRVCYSDDANGSNCSRCEKCYRTILEILSCNHNPADFGFNFSLADIVDVQIYFYENHKRLFVDKDYYYKRIIENVDSNRCDLESTGLFKYLKWLIDAEDIRKLQKVKSVRMYKLKTKIYKMLHG